jgi:predicted metal-binding protein
MSNGYKAHLFVCTNSPDRPEKCGSKNSEEIRKHLKEACRTEFGKSVRVSSSGCMGHCERGIVAVVYPQNEWLFDLTQNDSAKVLDKVREAVQKSEG